MTPGLPAILLGAGGHARVVYALAQAIGLRVIGVCDPARAAGSDWFGLPVLGGDAALLRHDPASVVLLNGVGQMPGGTVRARLHADWSARGYAFPTLVHGAAWVAPDAQLGPGGQVMAGAIVQPGCTLGPGCIVNTKASLDHDSHLGPFVHLAPGATVCGDVLVGAGAFIGAGATIIQGLRIGAGAVIGAGTTVTRDVADQALVRPSNARPDP